MLSVQLQYLFNVPNNFWIGCACVVAGMAGTVIIRTVHCFTAADDRLGADSALLRKGLRVLKLCECMLLCVGFALLPRVSTPLSSGSYLSATAVNESWWVVFQVVAIALGVAAAFVFDSNPVFRLFVCATLPLVAALNMVSEIDFANEIACIDAGICAESSTPELWLKALAFRDLASIVLTLSNAMLALWLTVHFGFFRNRHYLPRKEHREFAPLSVDEEEEGLALDSSRF